MGDAAHVTTDEMRIGLLQLADLPAIAAIHLVTFPDSALTKLGRETVSRYYGWLLSDAHPDSYTVAAVVGDEMLGFCFAGAYRGAMRGFLDKNRNFLMTRVLLRPWLLLTNELFRERTVSAVRILRRKPASKTPSRPKTAPASPHFGVLSIATDPQAQRKGVGQALMDNCEQEARRRGCSVMNLTVHVDNTKAIRFYEKLGWQRETVDGKWYGAMIKPLEAIT